MKRRGRRNPARISENNRSDRHPQRHDPGQRSRRRDEPEVKSRNAMGGGLDSVLGHVLGGGYPEPDKEEEPDDRRDEKDGGGFGAGFMYGVPPHPGRRPDEGGSTTSSHFRGHMGRDNTSTQRGSFSGVGPKGWKRTDQRIEEDLVNLLTRHPGIDATHIEVAVDNGIVRLSGSVGDRKTKWLAEDVAESINGVDEVECRIRVVKEETDRDRHERGQVAAASGDDYQDISTPGETHTPVLEGQTPEEFQKAVRKGRADKTGSTARASGN